MELELIKSKIANEIGVNRLPVPELTNMPAAIRMFTEIANEFLKKKNRQFNPQLVDEQVRSLINWAYMLGDEMDFTKGILFKGHTGVGKTFLFKVFNYFAKIDNLIYCENGKNIPIGAKIVNVKKIAGEFQSPKDGGYSVIQRYANYPCLVIDDIGKEQDESISFGNRVNVVEEIISIREEMGMLTFGTTNLEQMSDVYDDRTVSRMNFLFNVVPVNHDTDFRKQ